MALLQRKRHTSFSLSAMLTSMPGGYTIGNLMANIKTAISIQEALFAQVETLARELKIPRSQVFTLAVKEFVQRQENRQLLERMNAAYQDASDPAEKKRLRHMKKSQRRISEGEW